LSSVLIAVPDLHILHKMNALQFTEREKLTNIWFMFEILELVANFGNLYV